MYTHDSTNVTSQVPPTRRNCEVFYWVETVGIDHEITIVFIDSRGLASISAVEELREGLLLDNVDVVHVEPCGIAREDDRVRLCN